MGCAGASIADSRRMPRHRGGLSVALVLAVLTAAIPAAPWNVITRRANANVPAAHAPSAADNPVEARRRADFAAMQAFRPGYAFWQHIFTMPDGSIAYGSAVDGRLLATFPAKGDWMRKAVWADPTIARILEGQQLARKLSERREQVAVLLERAAGPVLHNSTRGDALLMNAGRYGPFLAEWGAIYERFGVPAEIGLAQVILESGLNGTRRSEANAVGFCQWLQTELEATEPLLTDADRRTEPDHAGALLRRVPVGARHEVRIVHSGALRAQRRRHQRRADADQRRAPRRSGCSRTIFSGLEAGPRPAGPAGQGLSRTSTRATARARISTRRWCSATRSTSNA